MKKLNKVLFKREEKIRIFFYASYFMIIASDIFNNISAFNIFLNILDILSILILSAIILYGFITKKIKLYKKTILMMLFLCTVIISSFISGDRALIKLPFLLLATYCISFDDFIKKDLIARVILVFSIVILHFLGVTNNGVLEIRNGFFRNSFGLGHPNSFAYYLAIICLDYYYVSYINNKSILKPMLFSIFVMLIIYFFVGSRTNILLILIISLLFIFRNKIKIKSKSVKLFLKNSFLIFLVISLILSYAYIDNSFFTSLDKFLSKRLIFANYYLNHFEINFFGTQVTNVGYALDSAYINLILRYGILLVIAFYLLFKKTMEELFNRTKYILALIIFVMLIYGLSESPMYVPAKNPYLILLGLTIMNIQIGREDANNAK